MSFELSLSKSPLLLCTYFGHIIDQRLFPNSLSSLDFFLHISRCVCIRRVFASIAYLKYRCRSAFDIPIFYKTETLSVLGSSLICVMILQLTSLL